MSESFVVDYQTTPERYRHWSLAVDGVVATLTMAVNEDGGLRDGYKLKLNSYDLGVDIELHDAIQRIRFEHPKVRVVVLGSGLDRTSAQAPIFLCWVNPATPGKSTSASSPTRHAMVWKIPAAIPA